MLKKRPKFWLFAWYAFSTGQKLSQKNPGNMKVNEKYLHPQRRETSYNQPKYYIPI